MKKYIATSSSQNSIKKYLTISVLCASFTLAAMSSAEPANIGVVGDSLSAECYGDYDLGGLMASLTESFGMSTLSSTTDCSGGNFGSDILAALLDGIMPPPMAFIRGQFPRA